MTADGVFRTILVKEGIPQNLEEHLERLVTECQQLCLDGPISTPSQVMAFIDQEKAHSGLFRLRIAMAAVDDRLDLSTWVKAHPYLSISSYQPLNRPLRVGIYPKPFHRLHYSVKALSNLDQKFLYTWGLQRGYDEVLTTTEEGHILEGAFSNCFWEEENTLFFIDPELPYYQGLTQERIMRQTHKKVAFAKIKKEELLSKNLYLCNSLRGAVLANPL